MPRMMRKCAQCGTLDDRHAWKSADDAASQGAFDGSWTCASCAWTEFDLVDADGEPARTGRQEEAASR